MTSHPSSWRLDPAEVSSAWSTTRKNARLRASEPRSFDESQATLTLTHIPTGVTVSGVVPPGNYNKAEFRRLKEALHAERFSALESVVARILRIPGR